MDGVKASVAVAKALHYGVEVGKRNRICRTSSGRQARRVAGAGDELGRHTRAARRGRRGRSERKWRGRGRVKGERCVPDSCLLDLSKRELRR